jgi:hypothetical protein
MIRKIIFFQIAFILVVISAAAGYAKKIDSPLLPPVPGRIIQRIGKENHPFLMASADQFRDARRMLHRDLFQQHGDEFEQRIKGFFNPKSRWYLGDGPLSDNKTFHPGQLTDEDFRFYEKVVCEVIAYTGIHKEGWVNNGLKRELERLLDEIQPSVQSKTIESVSSAFSEKDVRMLSLASLMYDMVYGRFATLERHPINNRINQLRKQLAEDCAMVDPETLTVENRIARGSALGLSTLLCISIYPHEWKKERRFSAQSFLPDLYLAITYTYSGFMSVIKNSPHYSMKTEALESLFLTTIPWCESLRRFGYPYRMQQDVYGRIVDSFETHRIPNGVGVIHPFIPKGLHDAWIPRSDNIFPVIDQTMYVARGDSLLDFQPFKKDTQNSSNGDALKLPKSFRPMGVNVIRDGGRKLSLREQLEQYGYPQKPAPVKFEDEITASNVNAGWVPPDLNLPAVWGGFYLLAERDNPKSKAGEQWEQFALGRDSHPYTFIYYTEFPLTGSNDERSHHLIEYPNINMTMLAAQNPREHYLLACQIADQTLVMPTYAIDHESFLLSEGAGQWRWFHEIPSSTDEESVALDSDMAFSDVAQNPVNSATPLVTSLFSCWETGASVGRTVVVRRHFGGIGSGYTVVAHFPDAATPAKRVTNMIASVPYEGRVFPSDDVAGLYRILLSEEDMPDRQMNLASFKMERYSARSSGGASQSKSGILNILFAPDSMKTSRVSNGKLGKILESEIVDPDKPFFYVCAEEQSGREMFGVKFAMFPLEGMRVIEWKQGIELIAVNTGDKIKNSFMESDADLVIAIQDKSMKGLFYLMMNGTYLRCKFSPIQKKFLELVNVKGDPMTVAWCRRRLNILSPPPVKSVFYAPEMLGFDCPGYRVKYKKKGKRWKEISVLESIPLR